MKKNVGGEKIRAEESFQKTEKHFSSSIKLHIAGQTAGPIGLKCFVDTQGWPGGTYFSIEMCQ